jgi:beta-N-acetylhexosaminidase
MTGLLRERLSFRGVSVSDAMDMGGITQAGSPGAMAVAAVKAGIDLVMLMDSGDKMESVYDALMQAAEQGALPRHEISASAERILALKEWVSLQSQPGIEVVQCEEHRALAYEVATSAVTLVRDEAGLLPLRLSPDERMLAIVPRPADLTPADTSSYDTPRLAEGLRKFHAQVDEVVVPLNPGESEIAALVERSRDYAFIVVATINASSHPGQVALVTELVGTGNRVVAVALRLPYDIAAYPSAPTFVCTYSLQPPSMEALGNALFGHIPFKGQLPVRIEF